MVTSTVAWIALVVNAAPRWDPLISNGQALLAACVAVAGTVGMIVIRVQRPAEDVWQAGREHGRREAIRERARTVPIPVSLAGHRKRRAQRSSRLGAG